MRPGGSEALTGLGYCELEGGNASGAAGRFRQAAGQGYAEAYIGLGTADRRMGRNQDALTAYERYIERLPSGPRASIARRQIEELRRLLSSEPAGGGSPSGGADEAPAGGGADPQTPATPPGTLPAPHGMTDPPPQDTPAIESAP